MSDGYIGVDEGSAKKLQTYANTVSGQSVHSEAVTPTGADGVAFDTNSGNAGAATPRVVIASNQAPIAVTPAQVAGSLNNGTETAVSSVAVQVLAASGGSRNKIFIQNTGSANARIGKAGVAATTGIRLAPGDLICIDNIVNAIFAIREGSADTTVFATDADLG